VAESRKKRPRDPIQLAKLIGDIATDQTVDCAQDQRERAAVELGRRGGLRLGGRRNSAIDARGALGDVTRVTSARRSVLVIESHPDNAEAFCSVRSLSCGAIPPPSRWAAGAG
jgi:hypothetical protein